MLNTLKRESEMLHFFSLCLTGFVIHGLLTDLVLSVLLVPVVKDKARKNK